MFDRRQTKYRQSKGRRPHQIRKSCNLLGLVNFYHAVLKNKANVAERLHRLLDKEVPFKWTKQHQQAFEAVKNLLSSETLLVHYSMEKPLTCDASLGAVGAVLSHVMEDGREAPIAYHSKTLDKIERRYSQLYREALGVITGLKKFHNLCYGRKFKIVTDHKPLLGILGEDKPIPEMTSPRLVRWALFLSNYDYQLEHRQDERSDTLMLCQECQAKSCQWAKVPKSWKMF